jgi:hypothetical protein
MEVSMVGDGGKIIMGDKGSAPDLEKIVDDALREMGLEVQNVGKLESCSGGEGCPVIVRV